MSGWMYAAWALSVFVAYQAGTWTKRRRFVRADERDMDALAREVHEAMLSAPHDGALYRMARAACSLLVARKYE